MYEFIYHGVSEVLFLVLGAQIEFRVRNRAASRSHQRHQYAKGHRCLQIISKPMISITLRRLTTVLPFPLQVSFEVLMNSLPATIK